MQAWRLTPHLHDRIKELKGLMTFSKLVHPNIMKVTHRAVLSGCVQGGGGGAYLGVWPRWLRFCSRTMSTRCMGCTMRSAPRPRASARRASTSRTLS
jgi:hypothetical protein